MAVETYYVYILKCKDDSYYTGFTNNLEKRINQHAEGINPTCYTYSRRPLKLVFSNAFSNPKEGIAFEKRVKGWSRAKKEALINGDFIKLIELSNHKKFINPNHGSTSSP